MTLLRMHCPVCNENIFAAGREVFDDRYGEPNRYSLVKCIDCGHIATAPQLRETDLPGLYGTFYPRKNINADDVVREAELAKRPFAPMRRWWNGSDNQGQYGVRPGEVMLDVGCGSGVGLLEAQGLGAKPFGIEADPNVEPLAKALGLTIHFGSLKDKPFPGQLFDLIVLNQVIEHLPEPDAALKMLRERLKPQGRIVLVFPNTASIWRRIWGNRWINWHIPYHLHHFNLKTFSKMARRCGLQVSRHRTITPNVWTLLQVRAARLSPRIGVASSLWSVSDQTSPSVAAVRKAHPLRSIMGIGMRSLFGIVNRIVDAFGVGDSLLVEVRDSQE